jgi:hypothetical protein
LYNVEITHSFAGEVKMMLYIGPDALMPLATALAAVAGAAMLFWNKTVSVVRALGRKLARLVGRSSPQP